MDHPVEISPLTKKKPSNPEYVERFEMFMNGWEMANAYSELNDPIDQRERFKAQEEQLAQGDDEANTTDEDFLTLLKILLNENGGLPPSSARNKIGLLFFFLSGIAVNGDREIAILGSVGGVLQFGIGRETSFYN
mgnify:CR=1 FL=1